jgi:lipid-A-disaccharide synthase-like uncharacterized protein
VSPSSAEAIPKAWLALGFLGQGLFTCRFLVQWIVSERRKASVIPVMFWWFSLGGGALLLIYAIARRDPVFVLGQGAGLVVYLRNLILIRRERAAAAA